MITVSWKSLAGGWTLVLFAATLFSPLARAAEPPGEPVSVLRVCADPNNLPLSNRSGQGFENKIAELMAAEMGRSLEYTWFPQRMGFIRNTLRAREPNSDRYKCDLVMGVPAGFELAATTKPYYRSTYAVAYLKGRGLDEVRTPDDLLRLPPQTLKKLKFGAFGQTPPVDWLLRNGLIEQMVPYRPQVGDPERYPGEIVEKDLVAGTIDVAMVWGPMAGYFARQRPDGGIGVAPFPHDPEVHFDFPIAMGVRFGEKEWKAEVEQALEKLRPRILAVLASYGVPLLDDTGSPMTVAEAGAAPPVREPPYRVVGGKADRSTFLGWRLFESQCAGCHGSGATGTSRAPDILPRVKEMSAERFVGVVLKRYSFLVPSGEMLSESAARQTLVDDIVRRSKGDVTMPGWEGEPNVKPHILDLYAYLRARADGALDERRVEPLQ